MIRAYLPSPGLAWDSVSGCMQTKLSSWLSLQGYMTTLRSEPYHIAREFKTSVIGLVTGSSRPACRGIKNRKAAFPEPNSLASLMQALDFDYGEVSSRSLVSDRYAPKLTYIPSAPSITSPVAVVPSASVTCPTSGSRLTTLLEVRSVAGGPAPSSAVASALSFSCSLTRWLRCQGCCQWLFASFKSTSLIKEPFWLRSCR